MDSVKTQSISAKFYEKKIKNNAEFYENEKKRVQAYMKNRYATDEEYRNRIKEQKKQSYHRRKNQTNPSISVQVN